MVGEGRKSGDGMMMIRSNLCISSRAPLRWQYFFQVNVWLSIPLGVSGCSGPSTFPLVSVTCASNGSNFHQLLSVGFDFHTRNPCLALSLPIYSHLGIAGSESWYCEQCRIIRVTTAHLQNAAQLRQFSPSFLSPCSSRQADPELLQLFGYFGPLERRQKHDHE